MSRKAKRVILLGWDAADWKLINPLLDAGQLPALQKLIENGVMGNIATLDPPLSPMLWTSIATGMTADKHGILGFVEPDPNTGNIRPSTVTSRKVKALWNILQQNGIKSHTVGWWPSHPAEPLDGITVSNNFARPQGNSYTEWPLGENTVHPPEAGEALAQCRVHPSEITWAHLAPFVPELQKIDQEKDNKLASIAVLLAQSSSYNAAATWILENQEWEFLGLYMNEIDQFSHLFMKYHPPQLPETDSAEFELYKGVMNSIYRFHDMMLERLMELAGEDTVFVLLSDHGFHSDHLRPRELPKDPAAPAHEHAPYGVLCISGPGIRKDDRIYGATLLDIAPTVLTLFGLPAGEDMDGRVLTQAFESPEIPARIPSWEKVEGNTGQHPGEFREDPWAAQEALKQLAELGYIEAPGEDAAKTNEAVRLESQFYLARVYLTTQRAQLALPILEELYNVAPFIPRYALRLVNCYLQLSRSNDARRIIDELRKGIKNHEHALATLDILEGNLLFAEGRPHKALTVLQRAELSQAQTPGLQQLIGQSYLAVRNWRDAERAFIRALALDPDNAVAHHGLAVALLRQDKIEQAIDEALNAVGLLHHFPAAHYNLGEALMKAGIYERAVDAFSLTVHLQPGNSRAHQWLVQLYENHLSNPGKAEYHRNFIRDHISRTIYIVSGLPRSGTSMLMQMLRAGGVETVTDDKRLSDEHNPQGYLEDDRVKRLHLDNTWLKDAEGKVIKVVAPLLQFLPQGFSYKIIYMHRDLGEILQSQLKMLGRGGEGKTFPAGLADGVSKQAEKAQSWMKAQPNVATLELHYRHIIEDPQDTAYRIASFIGQPLDTEAMAAAVNADLYRNKLEV
ncbi:MAG: alkaline phosphatase family protein [Bacteroidota bacterium]